MLPHGLPQPKVLMRIPSTICQAFLCFALVPSTCMWFSYSIKTTVCMKLTHFHKNFCIYLADCNCAQAVWRTAVSVQFYTVTQCLVSNLIVACATCRVLNKGFLLLDGITTSRGVFENRLQNLPIAIITFKKLIYLSTKGSIGALLTLLPVSRNFILWKCFVWKSCNFTWKKILNIERNSDTCTEINLGNYGPDFWKLLTNVEMLFCSFFWCWKKQFKGNSAPKDLNARIANDETLLVQSTAMNVDRQRA